MTKGAWKKPGDERLSGYLRTHAAIPRPSGLLKYGKRRKVRCINRLRPHLEIGNFSQDEEDLIIKLHALLGNRWALIAGRLPGRTENEVEKHWNCELKRKLMNMGIDPNNHSNFLRSLPQNSTTNSVSTVSSSSSSPSSSESCNATKSLNLDLTLASTFSPSSAPPSLPRHQHRINNAHVASPSQEIRTTVDMTLPLFR